MPCDQIRTTRTELNQQTNRELLMAALTDLGGNPAITSRNDIRFVLNGQQHAISGKDGALITSAREPAALANQIKIAYARQAINKAGKAFGWQVTQSKTAANQYTATKRR